MSDSRLDLDPNPSLDRVHGAIHFQVQSSRQDIEELSRPRVAVSQLGGAR